MMPFQRYLQDDDRPARQKPQNVSNTLDIQIPSFLYQNPVPTLAHGGGAEVVTFSPGWYNNNSAFSPQSPLPPAIPVNPVVPPSSAGLPVYSASGFDLLSLLARVATRPNPQVPLGPVDMTCSFVVVDTRRYDHPIVYCSPSFCRLTGYEEHEILGRNCRFLQAPGGAVRKGETRRFTSQDPVRAMNKNLTQDKEVQTSIVNFRKDGSAFINLVTVIPIPGGVKGELHEKNEVVWHIGFQVDLTQQPGVILDKVRDGTYVVDQHTAGLWNSQLLMSKDATTAVIDTNKKKASTVIPQIRLSEDLNRKLRRSTSSSTSDDASSHPLSLILLSQAPDFIHVVSLKGLFLYISPAITRVLGYDPTDLLNKTMSDIAHPEDIVPLERQLKESSTLLLMGSDTSDPSGTSAANSTSVLISSSPSAQPRPVDLVFRARTKQGRYVWLECRGRLHVEPGKGRKAIILSGRAREMGTVKWSEVKEMARGPTITRALIQSALAASAASNIPIADNDPSDDSGAELVQAGTKRRRESSAATNFSVLAAIELSTLPAKTTTAVHPHSRPLPGTTPSSSLSPTLTPPTSSRHAEFWGMLSGLGHASGSFISLSRGVSDVLGYHPTSGSSASAGDSTHSNLVAAAVGSLQQQQQEVEHYVDATTNPCGNTAAEYNVSASGGTEGNEGIGSIYRYQQAMVAGPSGSSASPSSSTETSSGSSTRSSTLSSLSLRDALIGRRLRDLIVADSDLVSCSTPSLSSPGSSSGYANSPSPYTPSTSYNEAAHFGIRPRNKGKQNNMGGTRELVEATLRAWDEENRSEAKGQEANLSRPAPRPPVNAHSFDMQPPPARGSARGKGKVKSSSPSNNNQAVTIRCWMKTANRRGEWDLHAPIYGNVIPVVITLYRAVVSSMGDADQDPVARGLAALREADANSIKDDELDVAPPPTLVQVRIDTSRSAFANAASPASSTTASESGTPAFSGGSCSSTEKELNSHRTNLPEANIFAELETGRGSSWQYELQQMRFQNRRMLEEIVSIEEALNKDKDGASSSDAEFTVDTSMDSTLESHDTSGDGARATSTDQVSGNGSINDSASPAVEPMSNTWPTSPMMETNDSISSLPTRPAYDPQSYSSFSPLVNFNTLMDNRYASNPPPLESPVISRSECPQYGYSQQPSQEQNFSQSPTAQSGSYGYDNDYSQIQYQHIYPNQGYTQHQSYVDEPMASPTDPYHSQAQQMQYTLHQPQPQLQQQGLDWGTAPTPHYHQQRRRSTYDGQ